MKLLWNVWLFNCELPQLLLITKLQSQAGRSIQEHNTSLVEGKEATALARHYAMELGFE